MTFAYSIYIIKGCESTLLYANEFRHAQQYESFGFYGRVSPKVLTFRYNRAPLELDAREFEVEHM
jgi:hypothetical protein